MSQVTRREFLRLGMTATGMLLVAACTSQQAPPAPAAAPTTPAQQAAAPAAGGSEVIVGVVLPYSKVYADLGASITNGMNLYLEKVGFTGGGRKIVLKTEDEEAGDPTIPLAKTRKLVEQDNAEIIAGYVQSPAALNAASYLDQNKIPTLVANAGANELSRDKKSPYIYRTSFSNWQPSSPMGKYVADNVAKKVALVYSNYSAGTQSVGSFKETFTGQIVGEITPPFPNSSGDFSTFITQIQQANPEAIYVFMSGVDAANFLKQASQANVFKNIKVTGSGFFVEQDVLAAVGDAAPVGAITGLHWALSLDTPENREFVTAYKAKFNKTADVFAVQGYDTAHVLVDALNAVQGKTSDKEAFLKAVAAVTFKSPRGDFKFDSATNNVINPIYIRELVKDPQLGYTNKVLSSVPNVADPGK